MKWLRNWWQFYFFEPRQAVNLSICRILFFGLMLFDQFRIEPSRWAEVDGSFWMPIRIFQTLGLNIASSSTLSALTQVWLLSMLLSCLGVLTRLSTAVSFILGFYLLGLPHNFGKTHHNDTLLVFFLAIMAVARVGDRFSLDRLFWSHFRPAQAASQDVTPQFSGEYTWPIHLVWILMVLVFFAAGVAKVKNAGFAWVFSDNMTNTLIWHHYTGHMPPTNLGPVLASSPLLCRILAGISLLLELAAPLAIISRRLRFPIIFSLLLMQVGIWVLLGVSFRQYFYCYVFWMPWDKMPWLRSKLNQSGSSSRPRPLAAVATAA